MTVTGATTAELASASYTPPYKYVTSYAATPLVTGTLTSAISNNPTVAPGTSDSQYVAQYLLVHQMSWPSYRYAYLLWMVFAFIALVYALAHHLRLSGGSFGAAYSRWGMRRKPFGRKSGSGGARGRALPSYSVMLAIALISVITIILCLIGADYIAPSSAILNFSTSFRKRASDSAPGYTIVKSFWTSGSRFGFIAFALMPLVVIFALKAPPFAILANRWFTHLYADKLATFHRASAWLIWIITTVHVALWTVQLFEDQRNGKPTWLVMWLSPRFIFGCIAYAAMTAVMALSLKPIRKHGYEAQFFYIAHVTFVLLTIIASAIHHPVLWWWMVGTLALWLGERGFRLLRMARINGSFSRGAPRRSGDIVAGTPYSNVPQSDKDGYGMAELKRPAHEYGDGAFNGVDKTLPRPPGVGADAPWMHTPDDTPPTSSQPNFPSEFGSTHGNAGSAGYYDEGSLQPLGSYENRYSGDYSRDGYPRDASGRIDPYASDPHSPYGQPRDLPPVESSTTAGYGGVARAQKHERGKSSVGTMISSGSGQTPFQPPAPPAIPIGYAQAQLLPSRTIRLTVRVARPFKWAPGQSVLLYLPELSRIQSHPFTITNNDQQEIVLLVKARKGLTRKLFEHVRHRNLAALGIVDAKHKRLSLASMRGGENQVNVPPVFVRCWLDGPMGSAGRIRWGEHSTVLIVCGGSGVSFGMAVCDYVVSMIAEQRERPKRKWKTQRVRFCWVAREYAEISWVAHQLRRCQTLVGAAQLQIDIFVTNANKIRDEFAPPRPDFAKGGGGGHSRRESMESVASEMSADEGGFSAGNALDDATGSELSSSYADVIDLTNYEDEEDVNDPAEHQLSDKLQQQGKVRRARSRKTAKKQARAPGGPGGGGGRIPSGGPNAVPQRSMAKSTSAPGLSNQSSYQNLRANAYPPGRSQSGFDFDSQDADAAYAAAARGSQYDPAPAVHHSQYNPTARGQAGHPLSTVSHERRQSYRSFADSTYGAYDPFGPSGGGGGGGGDSGNILRGPSPGPSMLFDDAHSVAGESTAGFFSRNSRTQSMVLLEDAGQDPAGDAALWVDQADYDSMAVLSEMARPGKPKLAQILQEEVDQAQGSMIVATCGPVALNTVVRNMVSRHISPGRIRHGDRRGHIAVYSEDYEA